MSRGFERNITARSRGGIMRLFAAARYSFEKNVVTRRTSVPWTVNIHASWSIHFLCRFWLFDIALPRRFANSCPSSESLGASACPSWWTRPPACLLLAYAQSTFYHTMRNLEGLQTSKDKAGVRVYTGRFLLPRDFNTTMSPSLFAFSGCLLCPSQIFVRISLPFLWCAIISLLHLQYIC